jgi:hypothetical protein
MDFLQNVFSGEFGGGIAGMETLLLAMLVSFCVGHIVAWVYMWTHEGLSYSRMFTTSLVAMPVIVSLVMILMAGNIFVALGLLAVFTVVRFRNVLKDTRDTTFVLWAIVEGMAAGTMRFGIAVIGAVIVGLVFLYLRATMFGSRQRYDVVISLQANAAQANGNGRTLVATLRPIFRRHSVRTQLASQRALDETRVDLSYRLLLRDPSRSRELVTELERTLGVSRVSLYRREEESEV